MLPDVRILVGVLYQCAAALDVDIDAVFAALIGDLKANRVNPAAVADREMARGLRTGIEMLVEPSTGRAVDAAFSPFYLHNPLATATAERWSATM